MAGKSNNDGWVVVVKPVGTPQQGQEAQQRAMKIIAEWARQMDAKDRYGRRSEGEEALESGDIS